MTKCSRTDALLAPLARAIGIILVAVEIGRQPAEIILGGGAGCGGAAWRCRRGGRARECGDVAGGAGRAAAGALWIIRRRDRAGSRGVSSGRGRRRCMAAAGTLAGKSVTCTSG